jgi:hypothetical protein
LIGLPPGQQQAARRLRPAQPDLIYNDIRAPRKTVASGSNGGREAQLYEQYSEHRKPPVQCAAGF